MSLAVLRRCHNTEANLLSAQINYHETDEEFDGPIGIEIRGSTSARDYEKKSFALKTKNENGTSESIKLLGKNYRKLKF